MIYSSMNVLPPGPSSTSRAVPSASLLESCWLAAGEYHHFGIVFFRHPNTYFHHRQPDMEKVCMSGTPPQVTSVIHGLEYLSYKAVKEGESFYAREPSGEYFHVHLKNGKHHISKCSPSSGMDAENRNRITMSRAIMPILAEGGCFEAMKALASKSADLTPGVFDLNDPRFEVLFQHPQHLRKLGSMSDGVVAVKSTMINAMGDWPPDEIRNFFKTPRDYGHDLRPRQLEDLAMQLDPKHVPAIVQAGTLPDANSPLASKHPKTHHAFRQQEATLLAAFGDKKEADWFLKARRSAKEPTSLEGMEAKLTAYVKASVPRLTSGAAHGPGVSAASQINR
jgi:hypothetical protein